MMQQWASQGPENRLCCWQTPAAAQRSLDIATLQYREGLTDFERVLDSQRVLFTQQELLVNARGGLTQNLIALYKAMGGGWEQGRTGPCWMMRRAKHEPTQRLERCAGGPAANARRGRFTKLFRNGKTMSQESSQPDKTPVPASERPAPPPSKPEETSVAEKSPPAAKSGKGSRIGAIIVLLLIVLSLVWYFVSDRLTPYTSQARVQAFVVPIAAEVAGTVLKVHVKNNDEVQRGQPLLDIDPTQYKIALQRSRSDYESTRLSVGASTASVESAKAAVQAAIANNVFAQQDATSIGGSHFRQVTRARSD
jgi:hypothetical protein